MIFVIIIGRGWGGTMYQNFKIASKVKIAKTKFLPQTFIF
jgi:hypothetical protein